MHELLFRFKHNPLVFSELLLSSFFINLLGLASSLYVIQVLNRYLSYGVHDTLVTLTLGVLAAVALEFGFRLVRLRLAKNLTVERNKQLMLATFENLLTTKVDTLYGNENTIGKQLMYWLDCVERAYTPINLAMCFDIPFAFLFVLTLFFISPVLGGVTLLFLIFTCAISIVHRYRDSTLIHQVSQENQKGQGVLNDSIVNVETLRLFSYQQKLMADWCAVVDNILTKKDAMVQSHGVLQSSTQSLQALLTVAVYAVGAFLVLQDTLSVGNLIGANILANRSLGPITRVSHLSIAFVHANQALKGLKQFSQLSKENTSGIRIGKYSGHIAFKNLSFGYATQCLPNNINEVKNVTVPLFESLNFALPSGAMLCVIGDDGTGKTTLTRLITGLLEPQRGQVLVDGVDLQQLALPWWRRQLIYLPQEPSFFNDTLYNNIIADDVHRQQASTVSHVINAVGLDNFIDQTSEGLETLINNNGMSISLGYRKRLAVARGLVTHGNLVIADDPAEGLDDIAKNNIVQLLLDLSKQRKTVIVMSQEPKLVNAAHYILDLNTKPSPRFYKNLH